MSVRAFASTLAALAVVGLLGFGLLAKGEAKISLGEPAPDRTLPVLGGEGKGAIADYRRRWVLVNLWASWCNPCREEAPLLERFSRRFGERLTVLGINVQDNSTDALDFVREFSLTYPQLRSIGDERSAAFGSSGVPENFLVDPRGNLALIWRGPLDQRLLDERVAPLVKDFATPLTEGSR